MLGFVFIHTGAVHASGPRVEIGVGDSDAIVAPGTDLDIEIWIRNPDDQQSYALRFVHAVGGPIVLNPSDALGAEFGMPNDDGDIRSPPIRLAIPLGTQHGTATISALVDVEGGDALPLGLVELTIGDAGISVASATLRPSRPEHSESGKRISTSLKRGDIAYLELTVLNSLGNVTNDHDVVSVLIVAPQALLGRGSDPPGDPNRHIMRYGDGTSKVAEAETFFTLKPIGEEASHIEVHAVLVGRDGHAVSNRLELNFAGVPHSLVADQPSGNLAAVDGEVRIVVSGRDSVGNPTDVSKGDVKARIVSAPAGADDGLLRASVVACESMDVDCEDDQVVVVVETGSTEATHGPYSLEIELTSQPEPHTTTAEVIVVGHAVFLSLELYRSTDPGAKETFDSGAKGLLLFVPGQGEREELIVEEGEILIAAALLRDDVGELVAASSEAIEADGVTFTSAGSLELVPLSPGEREIVRGVATARFLVAGISGHALLVASSSELHDVVKVLPHSENVRDASGLTSTLADDFSSWIAPNSISASELWPHIAKRGVRAIHVWQHRERRWWTYIGPDPEQAEGVHDLRIETGAVLWLSSSADAPPPLVQRSLDWKAP